MEPNEKVLNLLAKTIADQARREAMAETLSLVAKARANRLRREAEAQNGK